LSLLNSLAQTDTPACDQTSLLISHLRCIDWRTIAIYWGNRVLSANLSPYHPPSLGPTSLYVGSESPGVADRSNASTPLDPFISTIQELMGWAQTQVLAETHCKQLRYHNFNHALAVHRRAMTLFDALEGHWQPGQDATRSRPLIELCALSHDMVQEFVPSQTRDRGRQRISGVSETATFQKLRTYMAEVDQRQTDQAMFTEADVALVEAAIAATVCAYDSASRTLHQPRLYDRDHPLPLAARLLALADLGSLAMDGLEAFREEGRLLFLEENLDLIHLLSGQSPIAAPPRDSSLALTAAEELLRQRLLNWSRFQVDFAQGRLACCDDELSGLPPSAQAWVRQQLFQHLNEGAIAHIQATYPQDETTSLRTLVRFFQMDQQLD
jgi:hypothetical protein